LNFIRSPQSFPSCLPATILKLDNGLTLIHQQILGSGVAAVDVWVNAGSIAEIDEWSGMAHFLEHMIFKGTDRIPPGHFDAVIENRGGMTNAATSYDYAHFFMTTAAQDFGETLPCLAELLLQAAIPEDEFEYEREVVLEEIRQTFDNPDCVAFQSLAESVYQRHPYGRSILGTEDLLMQRTPEEMRAFHRTHYQPHNMTVVMVGDVDLEHTIKIVERSFHDFPTPEECPRHEIEAEPPITSIRRQELRLPRLEQARLMMAWITPGIDSPFWRDEHDPLPWKRFEELDKRDPLRDALGLDLLSAVLSEGRTSRLVQELREERQLVQGVSCGFSLQRDSSLFTITAWLEPKDLERVEALICDRLSQLITTPVTEAELARSQRLLCNDYAFSTETPGQIAGLYGYYHTLAQVDAAIAYPRWIESFNTDDLRDLASQYLSPYHYAATVVKPL
jgi:predicted Zn-dependent peptidase